MTRQTKPPGHQQHVRERVPDAPTTPLAMSGEQRIPLGGQDVAYLVGKSGETRQRLEAFSGARVSIDNDVATVSAFGLWASCDLSQL